MFGSSNRYDFDEYESFTEMLIATGLIWWLVVVVVAAVVMGCVTKKINEDRGYSEGFLWGFLLGVIGIVIVTCRPSPDYYYKNRTIRENTLSATPPVYSPQTPIVGEKEVTDAEKIENFKKLLDDGVITEEEFQAKKKQILGI